MASAGALQRDTPLPKVLVGRGQEVLLAILFSLIFYFWSDIFSHIKICYPSARL